MAQDEQQVTGRLGTKAIELVNEHAGAKTPFFSFEYYPPKTAKGVESLKKKLVAMAAWGPQWMDVTWGAGGTTADLTPEICDHIENAAKGNCMMHLTCTNMPREKIDTALAKAKAMGLRNILALRGDPPEGQKEWKAGNAAFKCALDLVKHVKEKYGDYFGITVSGYPEGHPLVRKKIKLTCEAWDREKNEPFYWAPRKDEDGDWEGVSPADWKKELEYLKAKVDAGGQLIITQLFYDSQIFIDFVKAARDIGIKVPILPGIMPIRNLGGFTRMTSFCRTVIPERLQTKLNELKDNSKELTLYGLEYITGMLNDIRKANIVPGFHFYTMNAEYATIALLKMNNLGNTELIAKEYEQQHANQLEKWKLQELKQKEKAKEEQAAKKADAQAAAPAPQEAQQAVEQDGKKQASFKEVSTF